MGFKCVLDQLNFIIEFVKSLPINCVHFFQAQWKEMVSHNLTVKSHHPIDIKVV